jgi:hypothetical protein
VGDRGPVEFSALPTLRASISQRAKQCCCERRFKGDRKHREATEVGAVDHDYLSLVTSLRSAARAAVTPQSGAKCRHEEP